MAFQQLPRRDPPVVLEQRQRVQQVKGRRRLVALGNPLEERQRALGALVENGRRGGEREDDRMAGTGLDRRFCKRQESGVAICVLEGRHQPVRPGIGVVRQIEGKDRLARRGAHAWARSRTAESPMATGELAIAGYASVKIGLE